jgi:low affinity Fe/Cu permease
VFLIQSTQNRDSEAIQLKLDELIRATKGAHNALLDLEELEESELDRVKQGFENAAEDARADLLKGLRDTGVREVGATTHAIHRQPRKPGKNDQSSG